MTLAKLTLVAAAVALSSTAAFAHSPTRDGARRGAPMTVAMERTIGGATGPGLRASEPTIWGHAVSRSVYVFDDRGPPDQAGGR